MADKSSTAVLDEASARRKRRQGSETRKLNATLQVRYNQDALEALSARGGNRLPELIRQYGDYLTEMLPVADAMGVDPLELLRKTASALIDGEQHRQAS
ncbi:MULTISPECIES: hypothetical protein [Mycolicibacterium]|uniref:Uncharacterized protein n=1 Tax=Mycolicibacterium llatzerense TaxID=280871 RepID=A0A0D1IY23_9MYCO|nr:MULTISPECIES: hypothetical protein [Mycolicibacterium]KIU14238.1 hypothetical protein TL10_25610 [Mycolicibacterium llatzerense]MCT7373346.1 hypothetical protein [Mycolicibacterium llatzerense]WGI35790.1 hypothetical protein QDT91_28030 [Mycolicibacterium aubagnense]